MPWESVWRPGSGDCVSATLNDRDQPMRLLLSVLPIRANQAISESHYTATKPRTAQR